MGFSLKLGLAVLATAVILISLAIIVAPTEEERAEARAGGAAAETLIAEWEKEKRLKAVKSVEEARELIGGTVWHYTKNTSDYDEEFGFWLKVEFRGDGTYTHYYAKPSDGAWTKDREGTFEIKEGRYSDSGRRYIGVEWVGGEPYGMPCNFTLFVNTYRVSCKSDMLDIYYRGRFKASKTYYGQMTYGDYKWD